MCEHFVEVVVCMVHINYLDIAQRMCLGVSVYIRFNTCI